MSKGIYVLFSDGEVEGFSICKDTIKRILKDRPNTFDIEFIKGKIAKQIQKKYSHLQIYENEALTEDELMFLDAALVQLPIDIHMSIRKNIELLDFIYENDILTAGLSIIDNKMMSIIDCEIDDEGVWDLTKCKQLLFNERIDE